MKWYLESTILTTDDCGRIYCPTRDALGGVPYWVKWLSGGWEPRGQQVYKGPLPLPEEVDPTLVDWTGFERKYYARGRWQYEQDVPGSDFFVCADPFGPDGMWTVGTNDEQVFPVANEARANRLARTLVAVLGPAMFNKETDE